MNYLVSKRVPNAEAFLVHCERIEMKSKSVVFRQGEPSEDLYLILDGSVSVIVDDSEAPDQEMVVSYLNPGEFFWGDGALRRGGAYGQPYNAYRLRVRENQLQRFSRHSAALPGRVVCTHYSDRTAIKEHDSKTRRSDIY